VQRGLVIAVRVLEISTTYHATSVCDCILGCAVPAPNNLKRVKIDPLGRELTLERGLIDPLGYELNLFHLYLEKSPKIV